MSPSGEEFTKQLTAYGMQAPNVQEALSFCQGITQGEFNFPSPTLAELLGREPESVESCLKQAYSP